MKKLSLTVTFLMLFIVTLAQKQQVHTYKGLMNNKMPITLVLIEVKNKCGDQRFLGMYKYNNISKWIELRVAHKNNKILLAEIDITGTMMLTLKGKDLRGFWISPSGKRKYNVALRKSTISTALRISYIKKFQQINKRNGC